LWFGGVVSCSGSNEADRMGERELTAQATAAISTGWVRNLSASTLGATFAVAPGTVLASNVIYGAEGVTIGARASIVGGTSSLIAAKGPSGIAVEPDARVVGIRASSLVNLGDRVVLSGSVVAPEVTQSASASISGPVTPADAFTGATTLSWVVQFPSVANAADVLLSCDETYTLAPGRYGTVRVSPRAKLHLQPGTYHFEELDIQSTGTSDAGTVDAESAVVHVRQQVKIHGIFRSTVPGALTLAYWGSDDVHIDRPVDATVVAPSAKLGLANVSGVTYRGAFFAKEVRVEAGVVIQHASAVGFATSLVSGVEECQAQIPAPENPESNRLGQLQYQTDLLRYCAGVTGTDCVVSLQGRARMDKGAAARRFIAKAISIDDFLGYRAGVTERLNKALADTTFAKKLCSGADTDLDWVPDADDSCLSTSLYSPTDSSGCAVQSADRSNDAAVHAIIDGLKLAFNPACTAAPVPTAPESIVFSVDSQHEAQWIYASRVTNQPINCPLYYQFELRYKDVTGGSRLLQFVRQSTSEDPASGMPWTNSITDPTKYIGFKLAATDSGEEGAYVRDQRGGVISRVRVFNGAGASSGWAGWHAGSRLDCLRMGFDCVER
jgi:hypothetical protein